MVTYPVFDVTDWLVRYVEPGGDDLKYWLYGAAGQAESESWLYKQVTIKQVPTAKAAGGGERRYQQGEDWVEKVASEVAALVGVPAARIELARRDGLPGLLSRDTRPSGWALHGGGILISEVDDRYAPKTDADKRANRIGHNLNNVEAVLKDVQPSPDWPSDGMSAFDQFAGFLLFDVLVANRDRHEYNWAVLADPEGVLYFSPSFDHGAALGSGLEDVLRARHLSVGSVRDWCSKATAHRFEDGASRSLLGLAKEALERASPQARDHWVSNVVGVQPADWQHVLERVPSLSAVARTFTSDVLRINQERIRDEFRSG